VAQSRLDLQTIFEALADNVYFQPPHNIQMAYPCIVYKRDQGDTIFAGNLPYRHKKRYEVTVIDSDPDSDIPDKVAALPLTQRRRFFTVDNLNHDVFVLYF
jgi:hypothetical protein